MFQPISRIENLNGVRFYEQDLLFDDYVYTDDIQLTMDASFLTPGIGIALMKNEGIALQDQKEVYLFKLGYREASVFYRNGTVQKKVMNVSTTLYPPKDSLEIIFSKRGKRIVLSIPGTGNIIEYNIPTNMDRYQIGIYSNGGNLIKSISVASGIPKGWQVNMLNTNGGYIKFAKSSFQVENCLNAAEIEQQDIDLPAGTYFLKYTMESIREKNDLKCFAVLSGDERLNDEDKNILQGDRIELNAPQRINIKFKGTQGIVKNIHITDKPDDQYVPTRNDQITVEGSKIVIDLTEVSKVNWVGKVLGIPTFSRSAVLVSGDLEFLFRSTGALIGESCSYEYDVDSLAFSITRPNQPKGTVVIPEQSPSITVFWNMDATISSMTITKTDGQVINLISEKTSKRYVPSSITSAIVVIDVDGLPLDLSSSYRAFPDSEDVLYSFTNWEREVFVPSSQISIDSRISSELGSVKIYGIPKTATYDMNKIFHIPNKGLDTLSIFCPNHELIRLEDLAFYDISAGSFYFGDISKYQMVVIDYLKEDSYCINFDADTRMYEVDISNSGKECSLLYGYGGESFDGKGTTNISAHKVTDIYPSGESYIALRREGF